jgi:hypothetical protein
MSSISKTADHVADQAKSATLAARASLVELGSQALRLVNNIRERELNGLSLRHLGRRRDNHHVSAALWFAAGAAVAGGAFLFLSPRGAALRSRIGTLISKEVGTPRDLHGEANMANEGGGSMPLADDDHQAAH